MTLVNAAAAEPERGGLNLPGIGAHADHVSPPLWGCTGHAAEKKNDVDLTPINGSGADLR